MANGHKKDKHPIIRERLRELITKMSPQLYICADEHNQQFILDGKTAIVIAGSGGTSLDPVLDNWIKGTLFQKSDYGFVSYLIDKNTLKISFISTENEVVFSHVLKK